MKIAILSPWAVSYNAVGGTERFVQDLAEVFVKLGNEVDVYMLSGINHITNDVNYINIDLFNTGEIVDEFVLQEKCGDFSTEEAFDKIASQLEEKINVEKYDCIHFNSQLFLKAWKNKKRIFTIHTNPFEYKFAFGEAAYEMMLKVMKDEAQNQNTILTAPSKHYSNLYSELTDNEIVFIPHAIWKQRLISNTAKSTIVQNYNMGDENKIRILLPSRVEPVQKQPMVFIKALENIDEELKKNIQIICTGLDKQYIQYAEDIQDFCNNNNINIKFMRFDTMSDAYAVADIVALPSKSESFGYSALEALSMGVPTIMNNLPTFNEIVEGYNGNVYIFEESKELEKIISSVLKNKIERIIPDEKWQKKYDLIEWGKKYISIIP